MEFALWVHDVIRSQKFDALAVELPSSVRKGFITAVSRLPYLSVLIYKDQKGSPIYLPVEPCDPLVEAVRSALDLDIDIHFVDLDVDEYPTSRDLIPDPYALANVKLEDYYKAWLKEFGRHQGINEIDHRRERYMAYKLQEILPKSPEILYVCGMTHLHRVMKHLESEQVLPLGYYRRQNAQVFNVSEESSRTCLGEFGALSAAYEVWRQGDSNKPTQNSIRCMEKQVHKGDRVMRVISGGKEGKIEDGGEILRQRVLNSITRNRESWKTKGSRRWVDRKLIFQLLFEEAAQEYHKKLDLEVKNWHEKAIGDFLRKRCFLEEKLLPEFFELVNASKGVVDDDFAYELWEFGSTYPYQEEKPGLMTVDLTPDEVWLGSERIRFRKRIPSRKRGKFGIPQRLRPKEKRPGEWSKDFEKDGLCSFPVEDIAIENFADTLKKKGASVLSAECTRTEPFTASLLDGIDYRETVRNVGSGRIYVKELRRFENQMGSVVLIFDEDRKNEKYNYRLTWLGEHDQESDLAFYATDYQDQMVGPGIGRAYYGGLMMSFPPQRLYDVWSDSDYLFVPYKHEVLLAAAIEYSVNRNIVYVGPKPPRSLFKLLAERMGKRIIYVPLGSFSPATLHRIRRFHVLAGHDKREIIREYI
jgi:hypothetical protein